LRVPISLCLEFHILLDLFHLLVDLITDPFITGLNSSLLLLATFRVPCRWVRMPGLLIFDEEQTVKLIHVVAGRILVFCVEVSSKEFKSMVFGLNTRLLELATEH
jgi:TRAP-type uncharacterized transport system fused permease subunit